MVFHNFRPEFINRIDEVVVFHPLGEQHIASIAQIQLKRLYKRLEERGYEIHISDEALKLLERERLRSGLWCTSSEACYPAADRKPAGTAKYRLVNWFRVKLFARKLMKTGSSPSSNDKTSLRGLFFVYKLDGKDYIKDVVITPYNARHH